MKEISTSNFTIELPENWDDVSGEMDEDGPLTVARLEVGCGALQMSSAVYKSGAIPRVTLAEVKELQANFATSRNLAAPFDSSQFENALVISAASYRMGDDFVRVWYATDRVNIAFITYVCEWRYRNDEVSTCESIVKTLRFKGGV